MNSEQPQSPTIAHIFRAMFAGITALVPIIGTILLLVLIYSLLRQGGDALISSTLELINVIFGTQYAASDVPNWIHVILPLGLIYLIGLAVLRAPGRAVLSFFGSLMEKIPFLGFIYSALKQFVDSVRNLSGGQKFKGVAYVEYPSPGSKLLGFITGHYTEADGNAVTTIFVPTSPNPGTGFVIIVDDNKVYPSSLTLEEAGKMILSAGLVAPERNTDAPQAPTQQ